MESQLECFPSIVRSYQPFPKKQSAYAHGRAVDEHGDAYIVKSGNGDRPVCAIEWICTSLAEILNLPVAPSKVLKMPSGELVFGSAELTNRLPDYELTQMLVSGQVPNWLQAADLPGQLSRIYAFDLLIGNHDRHLENFLMPHKWAEDRSTSVGSLHAIDFESADILTRGDIKLPMNPRSNTIIAGRKIRTAHHYDNRPVSHMLTQLRKGREFMFERAMYGLPSDWLSAKEQAALLKRVGSEPFENQIYQLEQGLANGSYL